MAASFDSASGLMSTKNSESEIGFSSESAIKTDLIISDDKNHTSSDNVELKCSIEEVKLTVEVASKKPQSLLAVEESANNSNIMSSQKSTGKQKKKNLRVTFPEGNEVSGYMDPPVPWDDVSTCTTEVLVSSYLKSCEKFGVKPIHKLLNQLQAIANFHERNETLTLKSDHLDYRHCETLEEVLRRVQFRTIDLEATKLDDEAAVVIFDMLEYYESCVRLNISFNRSFGSRGWQACARLIKKASCLQQLDAQGCNLADHLMPFMARALKVGPSLVSLHLENSSMSGKSLATLVMILKTNETLRELHLSDNKITASDAVQLCSLIRFNKTIKLLDLRNNQLQDVGMGHLCEGLVEQGQSGRGLETLVVWNNQLTYQSMNSLSRALVETKSLVDLNLGKNSITNEGVHRLKDGLLKNKTLLMIRLQAAKISCEGAVAIAEFLAETTILLRVDLRDNDIKTGGLMALSLAMRVNKSVVRVDLDKEPKKENGIKDYINQQKNLLVDLFSYVDRNSKLASQQEEGKNKLESTAEPVALGPTDVPSPCSQESNPCHEGWTLVQGKEDLVNFTVVPPLEVENSTDAPLDVQNSNSNNSSRSKLHLELEPLSANVEDLSTGSDSPPEDNLLSHVPLSPVVISQGTASLIPVESNRIFSPEGKMVFSPDSEENSFDGLGSQALSDGFEHLLSMPANPEILTLQKEGKILKKTGKMPREKRKKFIVTKTPNHHYHHHGTKKPVIKPARRLSNATLDAISAIDKTASAISSLSADIIFPQNAAPEDYSKESDDRQPDPSPAASSQDTTASTTADPVDVNCQLDQDDPAISQDVTALTTSGPVDAISGQDDAPTETSPIDSPDEPPSEHAITVCPEGEINAKVMTEVDEEKTPLAMNGLLKMETPEVS